jgi:GT2 family glycosyltransferase
MGLAAADPRGGFVCFLDNDTEVPLGWLQGLSRAFVARDVGIAGGIPSNEVRWRLAYPSAADGLKDVPYVTGACLGISWPTLYRLGGFDEAFTNCAEDQDMAYRAHLAGLAGPRIRVVTVPWVVITHKKGGTIVRSGDPGKRIQKCQELFYRKWAPLAHLLPMH